MTATPIWSRESAPAAPGPAAGLRPARGRWVAPRHATWSAHSRGRSRSPLRCRAASRDPRGTTLVASDLRVLLARRRGVLLAGDARDELPDPRPWAARFVQALVEIQSGDRPLSQLLRWTTAEVYALTAKQVAQRTVVDKQHDPARAEPARSCAACTSASLTTVWLRHAQLYEDSIGLRRSRCGSKASRAAGSAPR